jgi:hypothetical protein
LYNAAFQDGTADSPYPRRLAQILSKVTPLLALLSLMAAYDLWVRIDAYGLTSTRYWAVVVSIAAVLYSVGYAIAGFRTGRWMAGMGPTNVYVALTLVAMLAVSLTPALYPDRLAARSQARRLVQSEGTAGPRDFMSLRFDAGGYGYAELARIAGDPTAPVGIRKGAQAAMAVKSWQDRFSFAYTTISPMTVYLEAFPTNAPIDPDLYSKISAHAQSARQSGGIVTAEFHTGAAQQTLGVVGGDDRASKLGTQTFPYPVLFIDMDGDGQAEAIAFLEQQAFIYQRQDAGWQEMGQLYWRYVNNRAFSAIDLRRALQSGDYRAVTPHWNLLQIGKNRFSMPSKD